MDRATTAVLARHVRGCPLFTHPSQRPPGHPTNCTCPPPRMNDAMTAILAALRHGPKSTIELQALCPTTHAAKPIFDLRAQGYVITRRSLPNRVAEYKLVGKLPDAPVEAGLNPGSDPVRSRGDGGSIPPTPGPASSRAPRTVPEFGDLAAIRSMRR